MEKGKSIKVFAPATVANVSCGFDVLGFAVENPGDEIILTLSDEPGIRFRKITGDNGRLPYAAMENTAGISITLLCERVGFKGGIEIELNKNMPLGSGLGSSAASTVAGVFAANELLGKPLKKEDLLPFAMEGERIACGAAHADNVAPCLYGGFVLIRSYDPLDIIEIPTPGNLYCALVHPHIEVKTKDAREILRKLIPLKNAVIQWGNVGGLVAGLMKNDYDLIGRSLQDVIIEPIRSILIPGFQDVKKAAMDAGALGSSISGSGPSVFALCHGEEIARNVGDSMQKAFQNKDIKSTLYVSKVNPKGPVVIS